MANFIIRVELNRVNILTSDATYGRLHQMLEAKGLKRTIAGVDGHTYKLPTAMYAYSGNHTAEAVRDWLRPIISSVHGQFELLVMQAEYSAFMLSRA